MGIWWFTCSSPYFCLEKICINKNCIWKKEGPGKSQLSAHVLLFLFFWWGGGKMNESILALCEYKVQRAK